MGDDKQQKKSPARTEPGIFCHSQQTITLGNLAVYAPLTCDGRVAAGTLFGIQAAETLDTVRTLPLRGEGLASQRSFAARAEKTLFVPNLILVGHPSFSQSLQDRNTNCISKK